MVSIVTGGAVSLGGDFSVFTHTPDPLGDVQQSDLSVRLDTQLLLQDLILSLPLTSDH